MHNGTFCTITIVRTKRGKTSLPVAHARFNIFQGKLYGVTWCFITSFPVKIFSNREKFPTSGCACPHPILPSELLLGSSNVWWLHFRWNGPNRMDIAQLLVAHAHTSPFHPVAILLPVMCNGTFCTTTIVRKNSGNALLGIRRRSLGQKTMNMLCLS